MQTESFRMSAEEMRESELYGLVEFYMRWFLARQTRQDYGWLIR